MGGKGGGASCQKTVLKTGIEKNAVGETIDRRQSSWREEDLRTKRRFRRSNTGPVGGEFRKTLVAGQRDSTPPKKHHSPTDKGTPGDEGAQCWRGNNQRKRFPKCCTRSPKSSWRHAGGEESQPLERGRARLKEIALNDDYAILKDTAEEKKLVEKEMSEKVRGKPDRTEIVTM